MSCHMLTAVLAWGTFYYHSRKSGRTNAGGEVGHYEIDTFLWAGLWSALSNAVLGNVISDVLFSSVAVDKINISVQGFYTAIPNLTLATYVVGFLTNLTDKMISAVVSFLGYKLCMRIFNGVQKTS